MACGQIVQVGPRKKDRRRKQKKKKMRVDEWHGK